MPPRKTSRAPRPATLELPVVLDVCAAGPLYGSLVGLRGRSVELDASRVQRLGGQCLQVLLAAGRVWASDGVGFRFAAASPAFAEAAAQLGFSVDRLVKDAS